MNICNRTLQALFVTASLAFVPLTSGCDDEDGEDGEEASHGDTHDSHGGSDGDADTQVHWHEAPPMMMTAGAPAEAMWNVHTEGELHISELRACEGQVDDCGHGEADSFDLNFPSTPADGSFAASVMFEAAGEWTVVAYAHVGPDPFISDPVMVTVE